jgi:hypothetical protein
MPLNLKFVLPVVLAVHTLAFPVPSQALTTLLKAPLASSMEQLEILTRNVQHKVPGSKQHQKAWTHWCVLAIDCIKDELLLNLPHPVDVTMTETLAFQLGMAADVGIRPCFANAGSRSGYAMDFFCRARRLADLFVCSGDRFPEFYTTQMKELLLQSTKTCHITSIGGGPGYDVCALALAHAFTGSDCAIEGTIYDFEEGWSDLVDAMSVSTEGVLRHSRRSLSTTTCHFGGKCDITKSFTDSSNSLLQVSSADIIVCQYCVAENAHLLRDSDYIFFRDLLVHIKDGAIVILTETTHRLWPAFVDLMNDQDFQVAFVRERGTQLVLRKHAGCRHIRPTEEELRDMKQDALDHNLKMEGGHTRQRRHERDK